MIVRITKTQPSKFDPSLVLQTRTINKELKAQILIIGRGQELQSEYIDKADVVSVSHMSISRKHASLSLPYYLSQCNSEMIKKSMVMCAGIMVPKYFFRLEGHFTNLPQDLLVKIRQYCVPPEAILFTDLNSKFGLYKLIKSIQIPSQGGQNSYDYNNISQDAVLEVQKINKPLIQIGNQNIQIQQCMYGLSYLEMTEHHKKVLENMPMMSYISESNAASSQSGPLKYYSTIIKHYSQGEQVENNHYYCLTVGKKEGEKSNKIYLGRHAQCHIRINKSQISRKQLFFYVNKEGQWIIQDANSTNGTWLKCNKIIYKIENLRQTKRISPKNFNSIEFSRNNESIDGFSRQISEKLKLITIKLGEVRFDIELQGVNEAKQNVIAQIKHEMNRNILTQSYTRILEDISDLNIQQEELSQQEENGENKSAQSDARLDQSFELDGEGNNLLRKKPTNSCVGMNILQQIYK